MSAKNHELDKARMSLPGAKYIVIRSMRRLSRSAAGFVSAVRLFPCWWSPFAGSRTLETGSAAGEGAACTLPNGLFTRTAERLPCSIKQGGLVVAIDLPVSGNN